MTISKIDDFRNALSMPMNSANLSTFWKIFDRSLFWLRLKLWAKFHWILLLVLFVLLPVLALGLIKLPLILYIIDLLRKLF